MQIIPAVNEISFSGVREKVKILSGFLEPQALVHLDIVDGMFAPNLTWANIEEFKELIHEFPTLRFEIHLMVQDPEIASDEWFRAGATRNIVHLESLTDSVYLRQNAEKYGKEIMLSIIPGTDAARLVAHAEDFKLFQILSVFPGLAGQKFRQEAFAKIALIRKKIPHAIIEVDGGINEITAKLVKETGADILVASSFILGSEHPETAYKILSEI